MTLLAGSKPRGPTLSSHVFSYDFSGDLLHINIGQRIAVDERGELIAAITLCGEHVGEDKSGFIHACYFKPKFSIRTVIPEKAGIQKEKQPAQRTKI